jgi:hypothetical protein
MVANLSQLAGGNDHPRVDRRRRRWWLKCVETEEQLRFLASEAATKFTDYELLDVPVFTESAVEPRPAAQKGETPKPDQRILAEGIDFSAPSDVAHQCGRL